MLENWQGFEMDVIQPKINKIKLSLLNLGNSNHIHTFEIIVFHSKLSLHLQRPSKLLVCSIDTNLKELYQCVPCHLIWALNETEIGFNYKITLMGCNEKHHFL